MKQFAELVKDLAEERESLKFNFPDVQESLYREIKYKFCAAIARDIFPQMTIEKQEPYYQSDHIPRPLNDPYYVRYYAEYLFLSREKYDRIKELARSLFGDCPPDIKAKIETIFLEMEDTTLPKAPKEYKSGNDLINEVEAFNAKYKIGDKVMIKFDNGELRAVTVKHEATILGGHSAVGWFRELSGCYLLSRVVENH
jgi:hypothetical protein